MVGLELNARSFAFKAGGRRSFPSVFWEAGHSLGTLDMFYFLYKRIILSLAETTG